MSATTRRNIELLREGYQAFASGELGSAWGLLDPDVTFEEGEPALDTPSIYHGPDGLLEMLSRVNEGLEDVGYQPERFVGAGDRVLVEVRRTGRGSSSGVRVERRPFHVRDMAQERVVRFSSFGNRDDALDALGPGH